MEGVSLILTWRIMDLRPEKLGQARTLHTWESDRVWINYLASQLGILSSTVRAQLLRSTASSPHSQKRLFPFWPGASSGSHRSSVQLDFEFWVHSEFSLAKRIPFCVVLPGSSTSWARTPLGMPEISWASPQSLLFFCVCFSSRYC